MPSKVLLLSLVSFLVNFASGMLFGNIVFIGIHVVGLSAQLLGLSRSLGDSIGYFNKIVSGFLSDRFHNRRIFLIIGYGLSIILKPLFIMSLYPGFQINFRVILFFILNIVDKCVSSIRDIPRDALIADTSNKETIQYNLIVRKMFSSAGTFLGAMSGKILFKYLSPWVVATIAIIPTVIGTAVVFFSIQDSFTQREAVVDIPQYKSHIYSVSKKIWPIWLAIIIGFIGRLNESYLWSAAAEKLNFLQNNGYLFDTYYLTYTLTSLILATKTIRHAKTWFIFIFTLLLISNLLAYSFFSLPVVFICTILCGIFNGLIENLTIFVVMSHIENRSIRASILSITQLCIGISVLLSPLIANYMLRFFNLQFVFGMACIPNLLSMFMFLMLS